MSITHVMENGRLKSKRFSYEPKPPEIDTADLRRQIRLSKDAGHSKLPTFHTILEKLCDSHDLLNGKSDDWRRTIGK